MFHFTISQGILIAVVVYLIVGYLNEFAAENQVYQAIHQPALFDRGHQWFPVMPQLYTNVVLIGLVVYFLVRWCVKHPKVFENYLWLIALLFAGRVIMFTMTQFPPATTDCSSVARNDPLHFMLMKSDWKECMDYMFSGHALHSVLIALFVWYLSDNMIEKLVVLGVVLLELFLIIASRMHYTADVLVGSLVVILAFYAWPGVNKVTENIQSGGIFGTMLTKKHF